MAGRTFPRHQGGLLDRFADWPWTPEDVVRIADGNTRYAVWPNESGFGLLGKYNPGTDSIYARDPVVLAHEIAHWQQRKRLGVDNMDRIARLQAELYGVDRYDDPETLEGQAETYADSVLGQILGERIRQIDSTARAGTFDSNRWRYGF